MSSQLTSLPLVHFSDLGMIDYKQAWDLQEKLFATAVQRKIDLRKGIEVPATENHLLFCEHPHVYTLGKSGSLDHLLLNEAQLAEHAASFYKINRGGDITYHGPGQLVGYPIFDLDYFFTDIHKYMRFLEESVILTLAEYGIKGERFAGMTGVWIEPETDRARKICAMGVKCSRWVTMHGIGFNINSDLTYFNHIVPCGIDDKAVTSMQKELGFALNFKEVGSVLKEKMAHQFGFVYGS
jgi:lipoyl(octanoyl) transferase